MPAFEAGVDGIEVAGVNGGGGVRVAGIVAEGGPGVVERRAHEHREGLRKLLGVDLVLDCRRNRPVHGEPGAHRRRRDWAAAQWWL